MKILLPVDGTDLSLHETRFALQLVREGLKAGDHIVVYSAKALSARSRIDVVDQIPGGKR